VISGAAARSIASRRCSGYDRAQLTFDAGERDAIAGEFWITPPDVARQRPMPVDVNALLPCCQYDAFAAPLARRCACVRRQPRGGDAMLTSFRGRIDRLFLAAMTSGTTAETLIPARGGVISSPPL
jgi:hypothetical protein